MLLHLRVTVPGGPHRPTSATSSTTARGVAHLAVVPGGSVRPAGDLFLVDVARESADQLIDALRELHVDRDGGIAMETVDAAVSATAEEAERRAPGDGSDAVVWEQVVRSTAERRGAVGVLPGVPDHRDPAGRGRDRERLGAAGHRRDGAGPGVRAAGRARGGDRAPPSRRSGRRALVSLVVGFAVAIAVTTLVALLGRGAGLVRADVLAADRPATGFITQPDRWSCVVAVLAGVAGVLSLTSARSGRTGRASSSRSRPSRRPARWRWPSRWAAARTSGRPATQLGVNLVGILVAAVTTLLVQQGGLAPGAPGHAARPAGRPPLTRRRVPADRGG